MLIRNRDLAVRSADVAPRFPPTHSPPFFGTCDLKCEKAAQIHFEQPYLGTLRPLLLGYGKLALDLDHLLAFGTDSVFDIDLDLIFTERDIRRWQQPSYRQPLSGITQA